VEIAIGTMIRNGLSTKEIAQLRCISAATVRRHRENIRRKLGLRNRKANLATYLQASITGGSTGNVDTAAPQEIAGEPPSMETWDPHPWSGADENLPM
jgi:transposase